MRSSACDPSHATRTSRCWRITLAGAAVDAERTIGVLLTAMERSQAAGAFEETLVQVERLLSLELAAGSAELATVEETRAQAVMGLRRLEEALQPASRAFEIWVARRHDAGIRRTAVCSRMRPDGVSRSRPVRVCSSGRSRHFAGRAS